MDKRFRDFYLDVTLDINAHKKLENAELERSILAIKKEIATEKYITESVDDHIKRISERTS